MIVDARCRVLDKKDVYSVVHTKGFSCHLKVLTPATFENVGMYESKHCGMFDVTVVSEYFGWVGRWLDTRVVVRVDGWLENASAGVAGMIEKSSSEDDQKKG